MKSKKNTTNINRSWLAVAILICIAVVACGAASGKKNKPSSKAKSTTALTPTTYNPQLSLAPLVEKVAPAVVNIKTTTNVNLHGGFGNNSLFDFFFGPQGPRHMPSPGRSQKQQAVGSGFIIDKSGLVVTNHHVVSKADEIEVQLSDERVFKAELIGSDKRTDLALLKLKKAKNLPIVKFGNSTKLKVGDHVVAIGNPFGLDHTVTSGIVSAKARNIGAGPYDNFIQTDASINPGNSGGPLFNLAGEVVGINTAIAPNGQGIGFAIPSDLANGLIESLISRGKIVRGWLGIAFQPLDDNLAAALGVKNKKGVAVANVTPNSPAEKGGLKSGDVIVGVKGKKIKAAHDFPAMVANLKPGKTVPFSVIRGGKQLTVKVEIGEMPSEIAGDGHNKFNGNSESKAHLGFDVQPLTPSLKNRLRATEIDSGVVISKVKPGSNASEQVQAGDIIVEVNRRSVETVKDFTNEIRDVQKGDDLLLKIYRRGAWLYKAIRL